MAVLRRRRVKGHVDPKLDEKEGFPWAMAVLVQQVGELGETSTGLEETGADLEETGTMPMTEAVTVRSMRPPP